MAELLCQLNKLSSCILLRSQVTKIVAKPIPVSLAKQCQEISNQLYGMWKQKAIKGALELLNSAHRTLFAYTLSNTSDSSIHPVYSYSIQQAESTSV